MTNELLLFENPEFGNVRVYNGALGVGSFIQQMDDNVLFVASDVAKALGYADPPQAIRDNCDKVVTVQQLRRQGGRADNLHPQTKLIPESDLYALIVGSKLPSAKKFRRWVFEEVLPTIRRTGGYGQTAPDLRTMVQEITSAVVREVVPALASVILDAVKASDNKSVATTTPPAVDDLPLPTFQRRPPLGKFCWIVTRNRHKFARIHCDIVQTILVKGLNYKQLSARQLYRIDEAIAYARRTGLL